MASKPSVERPSQAEVLLRSRTKRLLLFFDEVSHTVENFDMLPRSDRLTEIVHAVGKVVKNKSFDNLEELHRLMGDYIAKGAILPHSAGLDRIKKAHVQVDEPDFIEGMEENLPATRCASAGGPSRTFSLNHDGDVEVDMYGKLPLTFPFTDDLVDEFSMDTEYSSRLKATGFKITGSESARVAGDLRHGERIVIRNNSQDDLDQESKLKIKLLHGEIEIVPLEPFDPERDDEESPETQEERPRLQLLTELWNHEPSNPTHGETRHYPRNETHFVRYNEVNEWWVLNWGGENVASGSFRYVRSQAVEWDRLEIEKFMNMENENERRQ